MKKLFYFILFFFGFYSSPSVLTYCSESSPDYFNPQLSISGAALDASFLLYDRLVDFDLKSKTLKPRLAKRWTISKDKKTYTFYLRKGVSFSSQGKFKPSRFFSADDVLFAFNRQKDPSHPYYKINGGGYKFFKSLNLQNLILDIKKINQQTVQFILKEETPLFIHYISMEFSSILSKEYGDWLVKKKQMKKMDFKPVGTGPFILKKYTKGSIIRYERNDKYFLGPSALKKIIFSITPDPTVRFQKIKRKECHLVSAPQPIDIALMKKNKNIKVIQSVTYNMAYLAMNTNHPILKKLKVRKAIAHALNRKFYIKAIYKDMAELAHTPLPPSLWGHNSKIKSPKYNLKKAKKLMKEAGYEKGFNIDLWTLPISRPYNPSGKKMGELMQADLKKIGINARIVTYDWSTYIAKSSKGEHALIQSGWMADIADPSNFLQTLLSCSAVGAGSNLSRWCNKNYDKLINKAMKSSSKNKATRLYHAAQVLFNKELPFLPLVYAHSFAALSPKVKGYVLPLFGSERFYHLSLSSK